MSTKLVDDVTLTRAQKRQLTVAERDEKARQEQKAFEAQSKAAGGRQAKLNAKKNATESDAEQEKQADKPQTKAKAKASTTTTMTKRKHAAPVIAIESDSDKGSEKASMTSTKSSLKLPRIDFTNLPTFTVKSKTVGKVTTAAKKALKKVGDAGKSAKAKLSSKVPGPPKVVAESESELGTASSEEESQSNGSDSDMADYETAADDEEFVAEVPHVVSKKAASIKTFESKDMEVSDAASLFDSDQASQKINKVSAHRSQKMQSDSEDEVPDAPPRRTIPDDDVTMHEAIAGALVSIPLGRHSRRSSTASWSSGQGLRVPDSDADDEDDAKVPSRENKKQRKVSAARQKKADLEKPQVRPAPAANATHQIKAKTSTASLRDTNTTTHDESQWHPSAQIIYPAPGKKDILLNSQTEELQRVLRSAIALIKTSLLFENAYPAIISRAGFARTYLVSAAEAVPEAKHILERLRLDLKYAAILADVLLDRINILRGDIKRTAASVAPGYLQFAGLTELKTKELIEKLLKDHRYIFPVDPQTQRLITEKPFHNPALKAIIKDGVFNRNFKANNMHLFISTSQKHPTRLELPDAMVALAATALYAALLEYRTTGERQVIAFTEGAYEDTYRNHMKTLSDTHDAAPVALHKVLHGLFNDVIDGKAAVPEAGSSAVLINLVEIPDSD
ncbi:hypothetical protein MSAN_01997300 [Mycena sanguinolenta]|uniref:DUF6532 domain-containing protein n=1 Tax=Mycena sanguinolenta TaxID=230812 RepID=A0A8H6XLX3_9AGAR|nr:hypothetical protein MSAN_01997300 [Mycena sanguinolenta]